MVFNSILEPVFTIFIENATVLKIGEYFKSLADLSELDLVAGLVGGILERIELLRETSEGLLDLLLSRVPGYLKDLVVILTHFF